MTINPSIKTKERIRNGVKKEMGPDTINFPFFDGVFLFLEVSHKNIEDIVSATPFFSFHRVSGPA
jgi:hypothetical protein